MCVAQFPKLSETFILSQIKYLLENNHDVKIVAKKSANEGKVQPIVKELNMLEKTIYINGKINLVNILKELPLKGLIKVLFDLEIISFKSKLKTIHRLVKLKNKLEEIDVMHCHFGDIANDFIQLKKIYKFPLIVSFHGNDVLQALKKNKSIYRNVFKYATVITANSNYTASVLKKYGCPENKIEILPMGIETKNFEFKPRKLKGTQINITSVGRMVEKKGYEYGIKAMKQVVKQFPEVHYTIAGDGPLRAELEELITENNLDENITLLGNVTHENIKAILNDTHIFLFPSVTAGNGDEEGQGVVLLEAQASGIPIISTFHDGIPESVIEGESAFLAPERDEFYLANKIEKCIDLNESWIRMGEAGRKHVENKFEMNKLGSELSEVYKKSIMLNDNEV
ncbi:glycosyltransferase [Halobacillus sp. SY10]|uniref:glycosyltransferase n=1 Tax=Halobacillus sp. SY10 TaxID=3381356 RepID=UPI003879F14D